MNMDRMEKRISTRNMNNIASYYESGSSDEWENSRNTDLRGEEQYHMRAQDRHARSRERKKYVNNEYCTKGEFNELRKEIQTLLKAF